MSDRLTLVIFDLDGTLVDSLNGIYRCIGRTMERHGLGPVTRDYVRGGIGLSLTDAWARLVPDASAADVDVLTDTYREEFLSSRAAGEERDPLFPGAAAALEVLSARGHLMSIATNKGRPGVHHALDLHKIGHHFTFIRSAHDGPTKPHPDAVHDILRGTGADARQTVFIGDTETDMQTAINGGVAAIGVGWGYHAPDKLLGAGAKAIAPDFATLPGLIEEVLKSE